MTRITLIAAAVATAIAALAAAVAIAAPVASKPPTISGKPAYQQTLTCSRGTWSADAVSFSYAWAISGGSTIATGQTLKLPAAAIDYNIVCIVTARDARGQTTPASSEQVLVAPGISTVKIAKASVKHGAVTVAGFVGPAAARKKGPSGWSTVVLDRIIAGQQVKQIAGPKIVHARNGSFTIAGHDVKGHHTYLINFDPSQGSDYAPARATRTLTVS
jgi:hypothetical protein